MHVGMSREIKDRGIKIKFLFFYILLNAFIQKTLSQLQLTFTSSFYIYIVNYL